MKVTLASFGLALVSLSIVGLGWFGINMKNKADSYEKAAAARAARLLPAPKFSEDVEYGPPYNVRVECRVKGSRIVNGERVPLDPNKPPKPGDVFVKTCLGKEPTGVQTGGPVG